MNSHKHLSLSQALAPILQDWNLKVIWIPSCIESIQCKGNYSLAGLIHLQPVWKRSLSWRNNSLILWTLCSFEEGKSRNFTAAHFKPVNPDRQRSRCAYIRLPQSRCYNNQSGLDIEIHLVTTWLPWKSFNTKCLCYNINSVICEFVMYLTTGNHKQSARD